MSVKECKLPMNINIYKFKNRDKNFFFDGNTSFFSEIDSITSDILDLIPKYSREEIITNLKHKYDEKEVNKQINSLEQLIEKGLFKNIDLSFRRQKIERKIDGNDNVLRCLWLNISHSCNMKCIYCFAHGGSYGGKNILMNKEMAKRCIDYWYKHLNRDAEKVSVILFGGEPLINKDVFYYSVNYVNKLMEKTSIKVEYNFTSNGTLFDDELIDFISANNIGMTISVDGGKEIQEQNRPLRNGNSGFDLIKSAVEKLKDKHILTARMTLTHNNIPYLSKSVKDLWEMGFSQVQYDIVSSDDEKLMVTEEDYKILFPQIKELTDITYENIRNNKWVVLRNVTKIIGAIHDGTADIMSCNFYTPFTLMCNPDGEFYKCQRLMEDQKYCIGNINLGMDFEKLNESNYKPENERCKVCWSNGLCGGGCAQVNLINTGDKATPYDLWCRHTKFTIQQAFRLYTNMYIDYGDDFESLFK